VTLDEFLALPVVSSSFPLVFRSGARWTHLSGSCGKCDAEIPDESLRGSVSRPIDSVFVIDAVGLCASCNTLTPVLYRLHEDMSMTGPSPQDGLWSRWEPVRPWWRRFLSALFGG
jgi:hypothetical protein